MKTDLEQRQIIERKLADSDIVPESYQNVLIQIRDAMTKSYFTIGDISNNLIIMNSESGFQITEQRIFDAVGRYVGKSGRTVRYYSETAAFYPESIRTEFEVLPFACFVFARSMNGKWREVLEFAVENIGASLDYIRYVFLSPIPETPDPKEICEISQVSQLDQQGLDKSEKFLKSESSDDPLGEKSWENSQQYGRIRQFSALSVLNQLRQSIRGTLQLLSTIDNDQIKDKDGIVFYLEFAEERIDDIVKVVNSGKM